MVIPIHLLVLSYMIFRLCVIQLGIQMKISSLIFNLRFVFDYTVEASTTLASPTTADASTTSRSVSSESALPILGNECRKRTEPLCGSKRFATVRGVQSTPGLSCCNRRLLIPASLRSSSSEHRRCSRVETPFWGSLTVLRTYGDSSNCIENTQKNK